MKLELAKKEEANKILDLYHSVLDTPYCRWSMHYPLMENVEDDYFCYEKGLNSFELGDYPRY